MALAIAAATLFTFSVPARMLADGELTVDIDALDASAHPRITFLVAAFDESGRPISGLTAQNFSVTSNSSGIPISSVQTVTDAQIGIASLLVVDTSGSMSGAPISAARQAAGLFVDSLKRGDQLGLIAFDTNVEIVARFTTDRKEVKSGLEGLAAEGNTSPPETRSM